MNKFIKIFKNFYFVSTVCVLCVMICIAAFGIKYLRAENLKNTAIKENKEIAKILDNEKDKKTSEDEAVSIPQNSIVKNEPPSEEAYEEEYTENENINVLSVVNEDDVFIMPVEGEILNKFSGDELVFSKTFEDYRTHNGIDIKAKRSAPVLAASDGVIEDVYTDSMWGVVVIINHKNNLKTVYKNLAGENMVKKGETVKKGQAISCVGETAIYEAEEESHLHFEVIKNDCYANPEDFINK